MSGHWEERVVRTFPYDPYEKTEAVWVEDPKSEPSDRFEDAARAEADSSYGVLGAPDTNPASYCGFMHGAHWARDHLAEQALGDAEVEAAVDSLSNRPGITYGVSRDILRVLAREALRAAARIRKEQER